MLLGKYDIAFVLVGDKKSKVADDAGALVECRSAERVFFLDAGNVMTLGLEEDGTFVVGVKALLKDDVIWVEPSQFKAASFVNLQPLA